MNASWVPSATSGKVLLQGPLASLSREEFNPSTPYSTFKSHPHTGSCKRPCLAPRSSRIVLHGLA